MKMAACPVCRTMHEAVGVVALEGADKERSYRITHCRFCETPSATFHQRPDRPELSDDEMGYPMAVVPWLEASAGRRTVAATSGSFETAAVATGKVPGSSALGTTNYPSEPSRLRAARRLLGGSRLFRRKVGTKLDVHLALCKGIPVACLLALVDGLSVLDAGLVVETLGVDAQALQRWRSAPSTPIPVDLASRTWSFAEALAVATQAFGGPLAAEQWMSSPTAALNGHRPVDLLRTVQGTEVVGNLLRRLDANVYTRPEQHAELPERT